MKIRLAAILPNSSVNGDGLRKVFFSQGCSHHCQGCFNQHTWSFHGGKMCDCDQLVNETLEETYLSGVTFCGGEPFQQIIPFAYLAKKFKENNINIWCFTGYTWEELQNLIEKDKNIKNLLVNLDVLIDGRFNQKMINKKGEFPGSTNQRIIDVQKSLKIGKVILWKKEICFSIMYDMKTVYLKPHQKVCPVCGSSHIVEISRITGYLAFNERFGSGKTKERSRRVDHNNKHKKIY